MAFNHILLNLNAFRMGMKRRVLGHDEDLRVVASVISMQIYLKSANLFLRHHVQPCLPQCQRDLNQNNMHSPPPLMLQGGPEMSLYE